MAKVKLTKSELKRQRDGLKRFSRYLPTLQLKKQQLQLETRRARADLKQLDKELSDYRHKVEEWIAILDDDSRQEVQSAVKVGEWRTGVRNIAGVETPTFEALEFEAPRWDLFAIPFWYNDLFEALKKLAEFEMRRKLAVRQLELLEDELRTTTQRVNLFEKVKIPEAQETIRTIHIYLGDQQTNAVGRAKIAKRKTQALESSL